jgi:hypothetical protein
LVSKWYPFWNSNLNFGAKKTTTENNTRDEKELVVAFGSNF